MSKTDIINLETQLLPIGTFNRTCYYGGDHPAPLASRAARVPRVLGRLDVQHTGYRPSLSHVGADPTGRRGGGTEAGRPSERPIEAIE